MKRTGGLKTAVLYTACLGMTLSGPGLHAAMAQTGLPGRPAVTEGIAVPDARAGFAASDVELGPGGVLLGQVVDVNGRPATATRVALCQSHREIASAVTDHDGRFAVRGLRGGTYEIIAAGQRSHCRAWAPNTAPPDTSRQTLVVVGGQVARGAQGPLGYWLGKPLILAGVVGAAVAIPVALHNHRIDKRASP